MIREAVLIALKRKDWSMRQLSQASGVSYTRVQEWLSEKGKETAGPKADKVEKILAVLGLVVADANDVVGRARKGGKK